MLIDKVIILVVVFLFIVVVLGVCIYSYTITKKYNEALKEATEHLETISKQFVKCVENFNETGKKLKEIVNSKNF